MSRQHAKSQVFAATCTDEPADDRNTVDGFSMAELQAMIFDGVAFACCSECGDMSVVEPDARRYDCQLCGALRAVTSPLVKAGLI